MPRLLCCSLASSGFTPRKSSMTPHFCQMSSKRLSDYRLNSRMCMLGDFCSSLCHPASDSRNGFRKTLSGRNHGVPFRALSQKSFFQFLLLFPSAIFVCILKLFLLPQCVHSTPFIRCDKPELTRWCLCSLHSGIQMSPDEVVGSRDRCRHPIAEGTVDLPIRLFQQLLRARTVLFSCPFA